MGSTKKKPDEEKKGERNLKSLLAMLRTRGFLQNITRFIRYIFHLLRLQGLEMRLRVGLDDPADTGMLFAVVGPAVIYMNSFHSLDIHIEPDFEQENLQGHLQGKLRVIPIKLIRPTGKCYSGIL